MKAFRSLRHCAVPYSLLLLLLGVVLLGACGSDSRPASSGDLASADTAARETELLFVVSGAGRVDGDRLSIVTSGPVTYLDDRPHRAAGRMQPSSLVTAWPGFGFVADPPNAVLTHGTASTPVELTDPAWDDATATFSASFRPLTGATLPEGPLGLSELFVDGADTCSGLAPGSSSAPGAQVVVGGVDGAACTDAVSQFVDVWDSGAAPGPGMSVAGITWNCAAVGDSPTTGDRPGWMCSGTAAGAQFPVAIIMVPLPQSASPVAPVAGLEPPGAWAQK